MKRGLIGKKLGMTQIFWEDGSVIPVTVIQAGPCTVVQRKTEGKDGYAAVQLGYQRVQERKLNKPLRGHFAKANVGCFKVVKEIRVDPSDGFEVGQEIKVDLFKVGDYVDVIGTSKGKGFAGSVKRHGFRGGWATHGSMFHRAPGSISASAYPSRVFKGKRLPGHMGNKQKTVENLMVVGVRAEGDIILLKGSVPGSVNSLVMIKGLN